MLKVAENIPFIFFYCTFLMGIFAVAFNLIFAIFLTIQKQISFGLSLACLEKVEEG